MEHFSDIIMRTISAKKLVQIYTENLAVKNTIDTPLIQISRRAKHFRIKEINL